MNTGFTEKVELSEYDKTVLYQRYHALKHRANSIGARFGWPDGKTGVLQFYDDVARKAPPDYTADSYRFSFSKALVKEVGYCAEAMKIVKTRTETTRTAKTIKKRQKHLLEDTGVANLTALAANLVLVLTDREGTPEELLNITEQNWR